MYSLIDTYLSSTFSLNEFCWNWSYFYRYKT